MLSDKQARYIAYLAIALSVVGFFRFGIPLGLVAMALSTFGLLKSDIKGLNWNALALGAVAVIIGII